MLSFFSEVLGYLQLFGSFIGNLFKSFTMAYSSIMNSITVILALVGFVPTIIAAGVSVAIVLYVIKFVIGR